MSKMLARAGPILARLPEERPVMVEVGVFTGFMASHLLDRRPDLTWHGVDNWWPSDRQPETYRNTRDMHAHATAGQQAEWKALARKAVGRFGARATLHERASVEAATGFPDGSADMVFLDGRHDYDGVAEDCAAWWRVVRPGGWLSSHDYGNQDPRYSLQVDRAIEDFAAAMDLPFEPDDGCTVWIRKP